MYRKTLLGAAVTALIAFAGLGAVSQTAEAGVSVHIGVPGVYGYWGPGYYAPYPTHSYAYPPAYYAPRCRMVPVWTNVWAGRIRLGEEEGLPASLLVAVPQPEPSSLTGECNTNTIDTSHQSVVSWA